MKQAVKLPGDENTLISVYQNSKQRFTITMTLKIAGQMRFRRSTCRLQTNFQEKTNLSKKESLLIY